MFKKKYFVIAATVIYLFLTLLFFVFKESVSFTKVCYADDVCVRFCCENVTTCNDKFIRENFKANISRWQVEGEDTKEIARDFKIIYGAPTCNKKLIESHENWTFVHVGFYSLNYS